MTDESGARISSCVDHRAAVAAFIAAAFVFVVLFTVSPYTRKGVSAANKEGGTSQFAPSQQQKQVPLETELITLQPSGFEPNEIRRPQGAFILGVDNRAGVEAIELQFRRVDGQRLNTLQTPKRKVSWREVVDLPPGEYVLSVAHHPEWTCNVTILPR